MFCVSTHSRLKAAGTHGIPELTIPTVSTHSRLKAAGRAGRSHSPNRPSFNTQPPEGGWEFKLPEFEFGQDVSTHSRLKAAGGIVDKGSYKITVSTHSRLKAAGFIPFLQTPSEKRFNTQPPEGGW